jgi:hypothetical protein
MYRILTASKDTYITNKIVNNKFRATDANLGQAGTLDLFKLYNESTLAGSPKPIELSRLLIKFDLSEVTNMHNENIIDIGSSDFSAQLKLCDIYGGQTTPNNFKVIAFPLSKSFDEGPGYDVVSYTDVGITNWITASYLNAYTNKWNTTGARSSGSLGDENIDVIVSGTVEGQASSINLSSEMFFTTGEENLLLDVTNFVSASAKNLIANHGFLIALSGAYEQDSKSYFVKRFASRNTLNANLRPQLIIKYDDTIHDNHENFEFDTSGSVYLNNFSRNVLTNLISGSAGSQIAGADCLFLKIQTGSFKKIFTGSQVPRGTGRLTGIYSSSFAINSFDSDLYDHVITSGSITFNEVWTNASETVTYLSSSMKVKQTKRNKINLGEQRIIARILNLRHRYKPNEKVRLRVFVENADRELVLRKTPYETPSEIYDKMYYRVRDAESDEILIPFDTLATRLSNDTKALYFDFYMNSVPKGRTYVFDFLIKINNFDVVIKDAASNFIIEQ